MGLYDHVLTCLLFTVNVLNSLNCTDHFKMYAGPDIAKAQKNCPSFGLTASEILSVSQSKQS